MDRLKRILYIKLDIYFSLTLKQQRQLNEAYSWQFLDDMSMSDFKKITKSKVLQSKLVELKRLNMRLAS